jgi:hypothetical protein
MLGPRQRVPGHFNGRIQRSIFHSPRGSMLIRVGRNLVLLSTRVLQTNTGWGLKGGCQRVPAAVTRVSSLGAPYVAGFS